MELPQSIWANLFLKLILWGVIIVLLFRILRFGLPFIVRNKKTIAPIQNFILSAELMVWIFYFSWFTFLFLEIKSFFSIIVIGVLSGILFIIIRFWLVDVLAGLIFKGNNRLSVDDYFKFNEFEGTIKRFRKKALELETPEGQIIYIPYRKLVAGIYTKSESKLEASGFTLELKTAATESIEALSQKLKQELISLPWSSVQKPPVIQLTQQMEDYYIFKITYYAIERSHKVNIENYLIEHFGYNPGKED